MDDHNAVFPTTITNMTVRRVLARMTTDENFNVTRHYVWEALLSLPSGNTIIVAFNKRRKIEAIETGLRVAREEFGFGSHVRSSVMREKP